MKSLFGGILLAVGSLIAGLSGLCSVVMLVTSIGDGGFPQFILLVLIFGGPPMAIGSLMIVGGNALIRQARRDRDLEDEGASEPPAPID